jgi:hypothetical protein
MAFLKDQGRTRMKPIRTDLLGQNGEKFTSHAKADSIEKIKA